MWKLLTTIGIGLGLGKLFLIWNRKERNTWLVEKAKQLAISKRINYNSIAFEKVILALKDEDLNIVFQHTLLLVDFSIKYVNRGVESKPPEEVIKALQTSFEKLVAMIQNNNLDPHVFAPIYGN